MRIKVFKNLYQMLSVLVAVVLIDLFFLAGYIASLFAEQPNYGWVCLVFIGTTLLLYFIIGFYWIFQTVAIDEKGVRVKFFNKTLKEFDIKDIECFAIGSIFRNPIIAIQRKDGDRLNIDKRKKALECLKYYKIEQRDRLSQYTLNYRRFTKVHELLHKEFAFLLDFGFKFYSDFEHWVEPRTLYTKDDTTIMVGYDYLVRKMILFVCIGDIRTTTEDLLADVDLAGMSYEEQMDIVKKTLLDYLSK